MEAYKEELIGEQNNQWSLEEIKKSVFLTHLPESQRDRVYHILKSKQTVFSSTDQDI